jgi:ribosome biogenesis GTPase
MSPRRLFSPAGGAEPLTSTHHGPRFTSHRPLEARSCPGQEGSRCPHPGWQGRRTQGGLNPAPPSGGEAPAGYLLHLGADPELAAELSRAVEATPGAELGGRVSRAERGGAEVLTAEGSRTVVTNQPVCTGDWVVLTDPSPDGEARPTVVGILPRRTAFVRQAANATDAQVLAANIDEVWIVIPLDQPLSVERLERTLVLAWESGAAPVVVATKADAIDDEHLTEVVAAIEAVAPGAPLQVVSTVDGKGLAALAARLPAGRTAALLGASGAGKSSLLNALAGAAVAAVGDVRAVDGKGRHTTSWRHLQLLAAGGALIDTPGLRAVGMWVDEGGIDAAFSDVTQLVAHCRFANCQHRTEPGCAVLAALADGRLDRRRFDSYLKLQAEAANVLRRNDARAAARQHRVWAARSRNGGGRARRR